MAAPATGAAANLSMTPVAWVMLLVLSVFWGGSFFFIGVAVAELPPFTIVGLRVLGAAAILWAIALFTGAAVPKGRQVWASLGIMAMFNSALPFCLIAWGQTHIASGLASVFIAATPLFAVVAAHFTTTDERMTVGKGAGVLIGFAGIVVLFDPRLLSEIGSDLVAQLAVLSAALCYALSGIYGKRFARDGLSPMSVAIGQMTGATLLLVPLALAVDRPWTLPLPGLETAGAVFGLIVFSTALAYLLFFRILSTAGATNLLLVNFLVPVTAILLGVLVLAEALTGLQVAGMLLVGLGLLVMDGKLIARVRGAGRKGA